MTTGVARPTESSASTAPPEKKKANGRSSLTSCAIVRRMRQPSRQVLSLLTEPGTRAVRRRHLGDRHAQVERMHGEFGLDLEALRRAPERI